MRYVYLVVALGLLVVATTGGGFHTAQAAQTKGAYLVHSSLVTSELSAEKLTDAHAKYVAFKEEERKKREAEQKRVDAINRFGVWGPDIVGAAEKYGQDPDYMYRVMYCESRGDAYADNGVDKGLFQFSPATWAGTPYGGSDINDGTAQIYGAAWMFSQGRIGEWPKCQYS